MDLGLDQILEQLNKYKDVILLGGFGLIMLVIGIREWQQVEEPTPLEALSVSEDQVIGDVLVDISGAVNRPGVYRFEIGSRTGQAVEAAEGFATEADYDWISKNFNLADQLIDGRKIYIPFKDEKSDVTETHLQRSGDLNINVNIASLEELEKLTGIGEARAQSIIDNRPYQSIEELETKTKIPKSVISENINRIVFF